MQQQQPAVSSMHTAAQSMLAVLEVASASTEPIAQLVLAYEGMPNGRRRDERAEAIEAYGKQRVDGEGRTVEDAPWRNQMAHRGAKPASTAARLPERISVPGVLERVELGYRYFNGNWIWDRHYLATQAPVVHNDGVRTYDTSADLLLQIYLNNVRAVLMVADFIDDGVHQYVPLALDEVRYAYAYRNATPPTDEEVSANGPGDWLVCMGVRCVGLSRFPDLQLEERRYELTAALRVPKRDGTYAVRASTHVHRFTHAHYYGWPDGSVPAKPEQLLRVLFRLGDHLWRCDPSAPVAVHCLAGHGRTGVVLAVVCAYRFLYNSPERVSQRMISTLTRLRNERHYLVQNSLQFLYAYSVVMLALTWAQRSIVANGPRTDAAVLANVALVGEQLERLTEARRALPPVCVRCLVHRATMRHQCVEHYHNQVVTFCSQACMDAFYGDE